MLSWICRPSVALRLPAVVALDGLCKSVDAAWSFDGLVVELEMTPVCDVPIQVFGDAPPRQTPGQSL